MDSGTKLQLLVELLNKYMYFFEKGVKSITQDMLQEIIDKINEERPNLETVVDEAELINQHFANTMEHIKLRQEQLYPNVKIWFE